MKQADLGLNRSTKRTRKREFLEQMDRAGGTGVVLCGVVVLVVDYGALDADFLLRDKHLATPVGAHRATRLSY